MAARPERCGRKANAPQKRNAYAREYYKAHADKCKAACKKCRQNKKAKLDAAKAQTQNAVPEQNAQAEIVAPTSEVAAA